MKKLLHVFCLPGLALIAHAQGPTTITDADMPKAGMSFIVSNDTLPSFISLGSPSPLFQAWDFISLQPHYPKSAVYGYTSNTPYAGDFTASNIYTYGPSTFFTSFYGGAPVYSGENGYAFWSSDSSGFKVIGWRADSGPYAGKNIFENPAELLIGTPASLDSVFNNFSRWELPVNDNPSDVDTFFITERTKTLTCDAWGEVITPFGTFNNVLRIHEYVTQIDSVIGKIGMTIVSELELNRDTLNNYMFMTKGIGYPVAVIHADVQNNIKDVEYLSDTTCSIWTQISGTVRDSSGIVNSGIVTLLQYTTDSTQMPVTATASIDNFGNYMFNDIPTIDIVNWLGEEYLIVAEGDSIFFPNDIPTYYGNTHRWDSSTIINTFCADSFVKDIFLIETPVGTGSGFCSGTITYGLKNKTGKHGAETWVLLGDPAKGLDITISQNPSGEIMQHTTTNESGVFSFGNLTSIWGYDLSVDIPGLTMDSTYIVTFTGPSDSVFGLDFIVDTTAGSGIIFIASPPTSIKDIIIQPSYRVSVFPNPSASGGETRFEIRGGGEGEFFRLEISDITGRNVKCIDNINTTTLINKGDLTPGLYIYKVLNGEGIVGLGKLIVQ